MRDLNKEKEENAAQANAVNVNEIRLAQRKKRKSKFLVRFLLFVLVFFVALLIYAFRFELLYQGLQVNLADAVEKISTSSSFPRSISNEVVQLVPVNQRTAIIMDKFIKIYSPMGKERLSYYKTAKNSIAKSAGNYLLVYNEGSFDARIFMGEQLVFEEKTDNRIVCANIAKNGYFAILTSDNGSYTLTLYNSQFQKLWHTSSAQTIYNNIIFSNNGKYVSISGYYNKNGMLHSRIKSYEIITGNEYIVNEIANEAILDQKFIKNTVIEAVTEKSIFTISKDAQKQTQFTGLLQCYCCLDDGKKILLTKDNFTNEYTLASYDEYSELIEEKACNLEIFRLIPIGKDFLAITKDYAVHFNTKLERVSAMNIEGYEHICVTKDSLYYTTINSFNKIDLR